MAALKRETEILQQKLKKLTEGANPVERTWRYLVSQYFDHASFRLLHEKSQRVRRNIIKEFIGGIANDDIRDFSETDLIYLMDEKLNNGVPEAARRRVTAFRALLDLAARYGWIEENVSRTEKIKNLLSELPSGPGHRVWTDKELKIYRDFWPIGTMQRLALEILYYIGLRISDLRHVGPKNIRTLEIDGEKYSCLVFQEVKNSKRKVKKGRARTKKQETVVLIVPELAEVIKATPGIKETFIVSKYGKQLKNDKTMSNWFVEQVKKSGLAGKDEDGKTLGAHGVRKKSATTAAENGATNHELMSQFGWMNSEQADTYTRSVDRPKLAVQSAAKLSKTPLVNHCNSTDVEAAPGMPLVSGINGLNEGMEAAVGIEEVEASPGIEQDEFVSTTYHFAYEGQNWRP